MDQQNKLSYKFTKIPMLSIQKPVTLDVSKDLNNIMTIKRVKKKKLSDYMCETALRTRMRTKKDFYKQIPSRPLTAEDFKKLSERCTDNEMSKFQEKAIRRRIEARGLEQQYPELVSNFIKEVKLDFTKIIHYAGMNMKIKNCHPEAKFQIVPYKFIGHTDNYKNFVSTRKIFKNKWILHYPVIRKIQKDSVLELSSKLFELHFNQVLNVEDIEYGYKELTESAAKKLYNFYSKIITLVEKKECSTLDYRFLRVATGVVALHISDSITQSLKDIAEFTIAKDPKPYMFLEVTFTDGLVLAPTPEEVIEIYFKLIDNILGIKNEIFDLETYKLRGNKKKTINLYLTEEFINNCKDTIKININKQFEPILEYLNNINDSLSVVYKDMYSEEFFESIVDIVFEKGCKKINFYREYLEKVMFIPDFEFFRIAKVSFIDYKKTLHSGLHRNINLIFEKLSSQHLWEVSDLCENFQHIKMRAESKPETTEELIEIGKFMTWIRNEEFYNLECRVIEALSSLCKIINLGFLADEHMQLNAMSIQWLTDILPIMEEQAAIFDSLKYDAEEKLQKVVEDVSEMVKKVFPLLVILDEMDDIDKVKSYLNFITLHMKRIREIEGQIEWINQEEVTLSFPKSTYLEYEELKNYVYPFHRLLNVCLEVQQRLYCWQDGPFDMLNYESTKAAVEKYQKELSETYKTYRQKLRQAQDENITLRFKGTVDDPDILNWPAPLKLCGTALRRIEAFQPSVKIMKIICNDCLRKRHWKAMSEIAGTDVTPNAGTTLRKIMQVDFFSKIEEYEIVSEGATKEQLLLDQLTNLKKQWTSVDFNVSKHQAYDIQILVQLDEIEDIIIDHNTIIRNMKSSVFVTPHETEVKDYCGKISRVQTTIENWFKVQNVLLKLYPIVSLKELKIIIPKETELLEKVIYNYNESVQTILKLPNVFKIIEETDIAEDIINNIKNLEIVFLGVNTYLDKIRDEFPRFYFISNEEFIKAISNSKEMLMCEHFLKKLFQNISRLEVEGNNISGIKGCLEEIKFKTNLEIENTLEATFKKVETEIRCTIREQIFDCFKIYKKNKFEELNFCEQVIKVTLQCYWSENIQMSIGINSKESLEICLDNIQTSIKEKIKIIKKIPKNESSLKINNIIVTELYIKELITKILDSKKISIYNFEWEAHFKYNLNNENVKVTSMSTTLNYLYEYLGNCSDIITPNTERCFRMLINTYHMNYFGLLQGQPDGGKFETVKTLASLFGNFLVKFVCSHDLKSSTLERFLKGSLLCGSWLCFENFTELRLSVMSGLTECLSNIENAKRENLDYCKIGNTKVNFKLSSFITICTTKTCYKKLPETLKKYIRAVSLLQPDFGKIAEIRLFSLGFDNAVDLSNKISCVFNNLQDLLSTKQDCYFGVSKLMKVLEEIERTRIKNTSDEIVAALFKVLRKEIDESNYKEFHAILHYVFPEYVIIHEKYFNEKIIKICKENTLKYSTRFCSLITEVNNAIADDKYVILIGKPCTSKTTILKICQKLSERKTHIHYIVANSYDYRTLHGYLNHSNEWVDGLVTSILRESLDENSLEENWIVFDGDINENWINNIKLKDRKVYLESGEVMEKGKLRKFVFEVENLKNCSPSVISQANVVYVNHEIPIWKAVVRTWTISCSSDWIQGYRSQIEDIFNWLISASLDFFQNHCKQIYKLNQINLVQNMIAITQMFLDDVCSINKKEEDLKNLLTWIQATIIQAGVIGLGGLLDTASKYKFDEFYKLLWRGQDPVHSYPSSFGKLDVSIPHDGMLVDYLYVYKQRGNWKLYQDLLKIEKVVGNPYMYEFLVPTADTLKYSYLLSLCIKNKIPVLLFGPNCSGKTILIEDILRTKIDERQYEITQINFNLYFNSSKLQEIILSKTNKRKKGIYSPPVNKNYLVFIDNLNQLKSDKYGNLTCLELLRQYLDHKVWYDNFQKKIFFSDLNVITATNELGTNLRFLRHFHIFGINDPTDDTVIRIYSNILLYIWKNNGFPSDIGNIINHIIEATFFIFKKILTLCKPTLSKSYYNFNLNNFSKVIQGCSLLKKETYDFNKKIHVKLWVHETLRTFGDRLHFQENSLLEKDIKEAVKKYFNESGEEVIDMEINQIILSTIQDKERLKYEEITDIKVIIDFLTEELTKYNYNNKIKINIYFFNYAMEKIFRISRVLALSPGNCLFLGCNGMGRTILTKLITFIYDYKFFQPTITQGYNIENWKTEIKLVLKQTGALENKTVFLINEKDLIEEEFIQYLEALVKDGDVSHIFNLEERQDILELSRLSAQGGNKNIDISSSAVFLHFNKCCKLNLHLIICFSIEAKKLRTRLRIFPALLNCHVIYWDDWPDENLQSTAEIMIKNVEINFEDKIKSTNIFIYFHRNFQSSNPLYISSASFIHVIKIFIDLLTEEKKCIENKKKRFSQGLAKISFASKQILEMQKVLAEYKPQLAEMTAKAIEMTQQIALETIQVEKASELVRQDEKIASEQAIVAQILKSECEAELAQAIPILEDAISALNTLKPSDITLVKSMKNPPDAIKLVMAAVCVIKDVKPDRIPDPSTGRKTYDYWGPSKRILGDMNFLQTLKDFDKDHIKAEIMVKIRKDFLPHKDFKPHVVAKASSAAEGLCKWIIAMDMYDKVAKEVAPKKEKLGKAEREYAETVAILNEKKEEVKRIEEKLAGLNALLEDANKKQVKLQKEVDICNRKLGSAQKLIGSLSEEQIRWGKAVENLEKRLKVVLGNVLLTAGIVGYLAPVDCGTRITITEKWRKYISENFFVSKNFGIEKSFSAELKISKHKLGDFLREKFFLQNIIIKEFSKLFSIFIDPDYQGFTWIKKIEKRNKLTITTFSNENFLEKLINCVKNGKPILIHQIKDYIPNFLYQFISKETYLDGEKVFICLNGENIQVDSNFRIYLVCNLEKPEFSPEIYNKLTIINFKITRGYLTNHFLKMVTEVEKPELRKLKKETYLKKNKYDEEIRDKEREILETLCESETDILEDEVSIKILEEYKFVLKNLRSNFEKSENSENVIQDFMNQYKSVATFVSDLYFCVSKFTLINFIYTFSLEWFNYLYYQSIITAEKSKIVIRKCENINKNFLYQLFKTLNFTLYQKDRFTILIFLTLSILKYKNKIKEEELLFFFKQLKLNWKTLKILENLPGFYNFSKDFKNNFSSWKKYISSNSNLPEPWDSKLTLFQKILLVKIFKPKFLYTSIKNLIKIEMGTKFFDPLNWSIDNIYNESYSLSPILLIQKKDSNDFIEELYWLLNKKKVNHTFKSFYINDNPSTPTDLLLGEAQKKGLWLLFRNCHLDKQFLQNLEHKLSNMNFENTNENFRLWLTIEPSKSVPVELLQNSMKVVYDFPGNFKQTLNKFIETKYISDYFSSGAPGKQEIFTKYLYGLVSFHCAILRRKYFEKIFWNPSYTLNENNLKVSIKLLQSDINVSKGDVEKILYVIGNYQYGTQLDNKCDIEACNCFLSEFLNAGMIENRNFTFGNVREYGLPKKCDFSDYSRLVKSLPEIDDVKVFGISENLENIYNTNCTFSALEIISRTYSGIEKNYLEENEFKIISIVDKILENLPGLLKNEFSGENIVTEEIKNYNNLLSIIKNSLISVKLSLGGLESMSDEIEEISEDILKKKVPKKWKSFKSNTLSDYLINLKKRIEYFEGFKKNFYWLGAFLFPKALFCQIKFDLFPKNIIPIEKMDFSTEIIKNDNYETDNIVITGLFTTNAVWDVENQIFTEIVLNYYNPFPAIALKPIDITKFDLSMYSELPLFQNCDLNIFICNLRILNFNKVKHWKIRGIKFVSYISGTIDVD